MGHIKGIFRGATMCENIMTLVCLDDNLFSLESFFFSFLERKEEKKKRRI